MSTRRSPKPSKPTAVPTPMPPAAVRAIPLADIEPDPENRQADPATLPQFAESIRTQGLLHPIIVRPLATPSVAGAKYRIIAGERRWRATRLIGFATINASVRDVTDRDAREIQLTENIQHESLHPLDEAAAYKALLDLDPAYTHESVALRVGKTKHHVYQRLSYLRLCPAIQDAFRRNIITPAHAERLAQLPPKRQEEGLERCFYPILHDAEQFDPAALAPIRLLDEWIASSVRLDIRSEDTKEFLPALAEQIAEAETATGATVLALSTQHQHLKTDDTDGPRPILAQSWRHAQGREQCKFAQRGVVVVGDGRGTSLMVCIAKGKCSKHWPQPDRAKRQNNRAAAAAEAKREEERLARQRAEYWRKQHYLPALLTAIATAVKDHKLTTDLLVRAIGVRADALAAIVGPLDKLTSARHAQLCIVSLALELTQSWDAERLDKYAAEFRVNVRHLRKATLKAHPLDKIVLSDASAAA